MASTYSPNLRLELIGTGEQQGTWGTTTNTNLGTLLEEAIGGYVSVAVTDGADTTLTTVNGGADQSRNMTINLTGSLTGARNVICPAIEKLYVVRNSTTGGFDVTFKVTGQTGVLVPNGSTVFLYVDGTDARAITGSLASQSSSNVSITGGTITGITDLAIADGGTGASSASAAATNLGLGTGDSPQFAAVNIGNATDTTITRVSAGVIAVEGVTVPTISSTDTLSNKKITPRISSAASQTSPWAWNSDSFDQLCLTALANNLTINADAGSPIDGQKVIFRIKPNTAVTLTWTTGSSKSFRAIGVTLPTSLANAKTTYVGCIYNTTDSRWDVVAVTTEA